MVSKPAVFFLLAMMTLLFAQCVPASTNELGIGANKSVSIKIMTSLPIIWGEGGSMKDILSGDSPPAPIYKYWQDNYDIEAVDSLEGLDKSSTEIVMLVQPRAMAPADLADLDSWVRKGGKVIIMTDPDLIWHSELPLGDPQRPLSSGLLSPLLKHWGLELVSQDNMDELVEIEYANSKIVAVGVGAFETLGADDQKTICSFSDARFVAQCRIGDGQATLVADADFLHEHLWEENTDWQEGQNSGAMLFTKALIDQIHNVSKD